MGGARSTVQEGPASVLAPRVDESAARQESRSALAQRRPVRAGQGLLGRLAGREAAGDRVLGIVRTLSLLRVSRALFPVCAELHLRACSCVRAGSSTPRHREPARRMDPTPRKRFASRSACTAHPRVNSEFEASVRHDVAKSRRVMLKLGLVVLLFLSGSRAMPRICPFPCCVLGRFDY